MPWPVGAEVIVLPLRKKKGVVMASGQDGRYRVRVEGVTMWCREANLAAPPHERKKRHAGERRSQGPEAAPAGPAATPGRVDLHGLRVDEAMRRVVDEIDHVLRRGADRLEVIHGRGSGRIQHALHHHLQSMSVVTAFKLDPRNPGVTWVYF